MTSAHELAGQPFQWTDEHYAPGGLLGREFSGPPVRTRRFVDPGGPIERFLSRRLLRSSRAAARLRALPAVAMLRGKWRVERARNTAKPSKFKPAWIVSPPGFTQADRGTHEWHQKGGRKFLLNHSPLTAWKQAMDYANRRSAQHF